MGSASQPASQVSSAMTMVIQVNLTHINQARKCASQLAHPAGLGLRSGWSNSDHWNPGGNLVESLLISSASQAVSQSASRQPEPANSPAASHPEFRKDVN